MPMVAAVATLEPDTAAKMAQEKMLATASRAGEEAHPARHRGEEPLADAGVQEDPAHEDEEGTATKVKLVALDHAMEPTTPSPTVQPLR